MVGPNYRRPCVTTPTFYKEVPAGWKIANPQDECQRGEWWKIFCDPELDSLEAKVNICNQSIVVAEAQYRQALALVDEARAAFFPTLTATTSVTRQKFSSATSLNSVNSVINGSAPSSTLGGLIAPITTYLISLTATWEPDLWGTIRRMVEASADNAQASKAQLASIRLSTQGSLAQFYFQLRTLDADQKILDDGVFAYRELLRLTRTRLQSGVASLADIAQAESALATAEAQAINNKINRAQYEHAIAVLIGKPPACFSLMPLPLTATPPIIPIQVPSVLLERRPDIAAAERQMAAANANIGVAISAYFPTLTLSANGGFQSNHFGRLFTKPALFWAIGPQLTETILDGGLRNAQVAAARATYDQNVATYRQTVLAAFQDVEDNLAALRILRCQMVAQQRAVQAAELALKLIINDYKAGTDTYLDVLTAQTALYTAKKAASDLAGQQMTTAVSLVKALGGNWDRCELQNFCVKS